MTKPKCEEYEIDIDDLAEALIENVKDDIKTFDDFLNLNSSLNREILIGEIHDGLGISVESYIRYWNQLDDKKGIPIEDREPIKIYIDSLIFFSARQAPIYRWIYILVISGSPSPCTMQRNCQPYLS